MATCFAASSAGLAFLLTTMRAESRGLTFEKASRELDAAIARFPADDSLPQSFLGDAEARGIGILNTV